MGNPNFRKPKGAPKPKAKKSQKPERLEQPRRLGNYWGSGPVLKVGLGSVGNKWITGKLWEYAQWGPSADIPKIRSSIQEQLQDALDRHKFRTIWRKDIDGLLGKQPELPRIKTVWLSDTGLTIYLYDFETQEQLAWEFDQWTAGLMPGATVLNAGGIRSPRVCGLVINNINKDKLNDDFFKKTIGDGYRIFAKNNPVIKYPSLVQIPYRVINMEEVSDSSWLITLNSAEAMKVLGEEPLNFFGVKTCDVELVTRGRVHGDVAYIGRGRRKMNS